ncbi:uncharacterized protein LOC134721686 isoform X1 [Mytilus trossulus]|uniref:uncharacterized protein LOC134721686 isoform X1 n=1 Tax=Mytilus trossulus TaxID=6551 RepID=UPI003005B5E8
MEQPPLQQTEDTGWCDFFSTFHNPYNGFVESKEQLEELKWHYEVETKSYFVSVKTSSTFGNTDIDSKQHKIQWREKNNLHMPDNPYIVLQTERFECHHGPDRNKAKKVKAQNAQQSDHSAYQKKRFHIQTTKKLNCPATIIAKEMIFFTDFKDCISKYKKEQLSRVIRSSLTDTDIKLAMTRHIFISLPQGERNGHQNHLHGEAAEVSIPEDKRIIVKIEEYVGEGLVSSSCLRPLLEQFVRHEIFAGEKCANWTNRRFFPSQRDISNFVYAAKLKGLKAKYDQENLMAHVDEWQKDRPEDKFLFSGSDVNTEDTGDSTGFFFLYQSTWQQRLLNLYGNEICLLDATYRTTKYSIPLFFLCVKTNVDYSVVAVFACQYENSSTITKALNQIKEWNPNWNPKYFMVDNCEAEIKAIITCFPAPDCQPFICDFHREQAWSRWLKAIKHGLNQNVDDVLLILRRVARAQTTAHFDEAISNLKESYFWKTHKEFRDWMNNTWLKSVKMWAWLYRKDRLLVKINTNNGVERQNRTLKYDFLAKYTDRTLTGMLTTVIKRFLPDQYRKYLDVNIKASAFYKQYNQHIPAFLHNRPKELIDHCRKRISPAEEVEGKIVKGEDGLFTVGSFTDQNTTYVVSVGSDTEVPSCQCEDWLRSHWPCKHLLAVIMHFPESSWNDLPVHYRDNPMFILDELCIQDIGFKVPTDSYDEPLYEEAKKASKIESPIKLETDEDQDLTSTIREQLEQIKGLTYLEVPYAIQRKALDQLILLTDLLHLSVPSGSNLPLLESKATVKSSFKAPFHITKKKSKLGLRKTTSGRRKFKELPSRTKRKAAKKNFQKVQSRDINAEPKDFIDGIMDELISGTTCLEETKDSLKEDTLRNNCSKESNVDTHRKAVTVQKKRKLIDNTTDDTETSKKKMKFNFKGTMPTKMITEKNAKAKQGSKGKILTSSQPDDKDPCKEKILVKLKGYLKTLTPRNWEDLAAKANYVKGTAAKRAAVALDSAVEDAHVLISVVKTHVPS